MGIPNDGKQNTDDETECLQIRVAKRLTCLNFCDSFIVSPRPAPRPNHIMERLRVDFLEQEVGINTDIKWDSLGSRLGLSEGEIRELECDHQLRQLSVEEEECLIGG